MPTLLRILCVLFLISSLSGCALFKPGPVDKLKVKDLKNGDGIEIRRGMEVTVQYVGKLRNGEVFVDSREGGTPKRFVVGGSEVLAAWDIGVVGMHEGGTRRLTVPHWLAYGRTGVNCDAEGENCTVPPLTPVVFDLELVEVHEKTIYQ